MSSFALDIEWLSDNGEPTTWFVICDTDEQENTIRDWLANVHTYDDWYVGRLNLSTFEEFKRAVMDEYEEVS